MFGHVGSVVDIWWMDDNSIQHSLTSLSDTSLWVGCFSGVFGYFSLDELH